MATSVPATPALSDAVSKTPVAPIDLIPTPKQTPLVTVNDVSDKFALAFALYSTY